MFSSSRLESLDTTGVHRVNSFPPWNSRMVMWIRKCQQSPKIQFWANCPFKEDAQRPARRGKRRDKLLRDLLILILKPNRRHHHARRREMSDEERQAADSEGELSSSLSPWLFNEVWAHVPPKRKYKDTSLKMECRFGFFFYWPPSSLPAPPWQLLIGGTQVSWRHRWCVYAGRLKAKRSLADCRDAVHHQTEKWGFSLCLGQIALTLSGFFFFNPQQRWVKQLSYYCYYYYLIIGV